MLGISERVRKWRANGWKTSSHTPVANCDLWEQLLERVERFVTDGAHVAFWHIPRRFNTLADQHAKLGAVCRADSRQRLTLQAMPSVAGQHEVMEMPIV